MNLQFAPVAIAALLLSAASALVYAVDIAAAIAVPSDNLVVMSTDYASPIWESNDAGKVNGKQLARTAANHTWSISRRLVQVNRAYRRRLNAQGCIAPVDVCNANNADAKKTVKYEAHYVFYKAS